jgi:N-acetyl sugar amidotransferase
MNNKNKLFCKKCVNPISAVNVNFSLESICSVCKSHETFWKISRKDWKKRKILLENILKKYKKQSSKQNYDCIVPVSGGKDSYYQTHIVQSFGLKPLLVTYDGDNYTEEGAYNRDRMRHVFNTDHIVFGPSIEKLKILNLAAFKLMGDMNWHNHCGITTYPVLIANKLKIPLIIWGETPLDIFGMYNSNDLVEMSNRIRIEHDLRGFNSNDLIKASNGKLNEQDMLWTNYPNENELFQNNVRGIYIGNYIKWDPNRHYKQMRKLYGWKTKKKPFDRTYRNFSNLDNIFENGVHDYLKFIKFGYGRGTDHSSKDIREGVIDRKKGVKNVLKYDHVIPKDLNYWCKYVGISNDEFFKIADKFRSKDVWWIENSKWHRYCIDGKVRSYGFTTFTTKEINKFNKN